MGLQFLPDEIVWNILVRVPTLDLIRLQCVCKRLKSIIEEPSFRQLQSSCSASNPNNRFIMLPQHERVLFYGLADIDKTRIFKSELVYPKKYGIVKSHNGLICYQYEFGRIIVMNPFTKQQVLLPEVDGTESCYFFEVCGFYFDPTTNFYKVMALVCRELPCHCEFMIFDSGSKRWRSTGEPPASFIMNRSLQVLVNERLHWVAPVQHPVWNIIVSFDLIDETFSTIRLPLDGSLECLQLMAFDDKLCILTNYLVGQNFHQRMWVMKEYGVEESWKNEFNVQHTMPFEVQPEDFTAYPVGEFDNGKVILQLSEGTIFFHDLKGEGYWLIRLPMETLKEKQNQVLGALGVAIMFFHFASLCSIPPDF